MEKRSFIIRFVGHLKTISKHKYLVTTLCFKCGMYKQGLLHDLSKFTPLEFFSGVKYWQGFRSPIDAEREDKGYSLGWLHHEGRNRHHWEHWIDKNYQDKTLYVLHIPLNYILEGMCDRMAASMTYNKNYSDKEPYEFFKNGKDKIFMGKDNADRYEMLLKYLAENGEEKALLYYKQLYKKWKKDHQFDI